MIGGQHERSQAERELPVHIRDAMDRARSLVDPMTGNRITPKEAATYVNSWLPEGDPGRMIVSD